MEFRRHILLLGIGSVPAQPTGIYNQFSGIGTIGPTKDVTQVFAIYEAENENTVRQLVESDPYWQNGIWTEYSIKEWIQAF